MSEFTHYGHRTVKDMENCSACVLLYSKNKPDYAAWPLSFIRNGRPIPAKYLKALKEELLSDNKAYVDHLKDELAKINFRFE